jgi:hypothetical protein
MTECLANPVVSSGAPPPIIGRSKTIHTDHRGDIAELSPSGGNLFVDANAVGNNLEITISVVFEDLP